MAKSNSYRKIQLYLSEKEDIIKFNLLKTEIMSPLFLQIGKTENPSDKEVFLFMLHSSERL